MGEDYIPNTEESDWEENIEGVHELQFDLNIVKQNITLLQRDILEDLSLRKEVEIGNESVPYGFKFGYADILTGKITKLDNHLLAKDIQNEAAKQSRAFQVKVARNLDSGRTLILGYELKTTFSKKAELNFKKSVDELNRIEKEGEAKRKKV